MPYTSVLSRIAFRFMSALYRLPVVKMYQEHRESMVTSEAAIRRAQAEKQYISLQLQRAALRAQRRPTPPPGR